jgi:hypothetical protein
MALETGTYINSLVATNPAATDALAAADDHLRLIKSTIKNTFPNIDAAMSATEDELNILDGATVTTAELNLLDGVTATTAELNILDGVTSTAAELNTLDGFTGTVDDLNYAKDLRATGVTSTEFDYLDGVTSSIQTQLDSLDTSIDNKTALKDYALYTSSGSFTVPSNTKKLIIKASGGGGGGGSINPSGYTAQSGSNGGDTSVTQSTLGISISAKGGRAGKAGENTSSTGGFVTGSTGGTVLNGGGSPGGNAGGHSGSVGSGHDGGPGSLVVAELTDPSSQSISFTIGSGGAAGNSSYSTPGAGGWVEFWVFG